MPFNLRGKDKDQGFTVVIDAGHGGKDIGATDNGVMEKNINLQVAKQLQNLIKKKMKDTKVVMTRSDDSYLTLQQRADVANKSKGDLFISIHTNSVDKKNKNRKAVAGSSVYALGLHKDENNQEVARRENSVIELESNFEQKYSGFDPQKDESYIIFEMAQKKNLSQSIKFAEEVEKELVASGRKDRGVHQAGFWVLWATSMPSVLIELDFICNPESAKYLASEKGSKELAEAIFKALKKYEEEWRKKNKNLDHITAAPSDNDNNASEDIILIAQNDQTQTVEIEEYTKANKRKRTSDISSPINANKNINNTGRRRRSRKERGKEFGVDFESKSISESLLASSSPEKYIFVEDAASEVEETVDMKKEEKNDKKTSSKTKKPKKEKKHNAKREKITTVYKIQILASYDLLKQNNPRFCGLKPISTYKENDQYKYFYGESKDKDEIEQLLKAVKKKIPDAFIVATTKSNKRK